MFFTRITLPGFKSVIFGAMARKRKASDGLLQPCSKKVHKSQVNEEGIDEVEKVNNNMSQVNEEGIDEVEKVSNNMSQVNEEGIDEVEKASNNMSMSEPEPEDGNINLCGIPLAPPSQTTNSGVIFVLEKASLVLAHVGKTYQILCADEHADYLRKKKLNPYDYRPDIVYQALCEIMDSRIVKAHKLKAIYISTDDGALIKVEPNAAMPKSLKKFRSMMAELRQNFYVKSSGNNSEILRLLKNPVTKYLPVNSRKIGLSFSSKKMVDIRDYVNDIGSCEDIVFVVGTMAHGKIECDYLDDLISVSPSHMSSATCLSNIITELERKWGVH